VYLCGHLHVANSSPRVQLVIIYEVNKKDTKTGKKKKKQKETQTPKQEPAHKIQRPLLHHGKGTLAFARARTKTPS
jgi:hypothetical protein